MSTFTDTDLSPQQLRAIDPICDAFESEWKDGRRPTIEEALPHVAEALRTLLLSELIRTELEWRFRVGEAPNPHEYRQRFPRCAEALDDWLREARRAAEQLGTVAGTETVSYERSSRQTSDGDEPAKQETAPLPRMLGDYELLEPFKPGGMGEVYTARHRRLNKLVALKLLSRNYRNSANMLARFRREMEAVGRLDHPNLVEAHDAGEDDGLVYLVMKLIPGDDLSGLVRIRGPLPIAEACELIRQAALGLHELHQCGLVHRDIKPSNIRRTPDGIVKVIDLGLARWDNKPVGDDEVTEPGVLIGTPDYIAPEQSSNPTGVDSRTDLYGLGCTLFFLLTGRAPFAHREGMLAKVRAHESEEPRDVRELRPEVPAALAELVSRLLAKRPVDRPQTAFEVATELAAFAQGSATPPLSPAPGTETSIPLPRPRRGRRPYRRVWLTASMCLLAPLLGLALLLAGRQRPDRISTHLPDKDGTATGHVRIVDLDVQHFGSTEKGDQPLGLLGKDSFIVRCDDSVTVEARLSRRAYAYVIAFRPDGSDEVCFPEKEDEVPVLTVRPCYPSESRGVNYGLNEGPGLQVFAVVVSSQPLPAYREWRAHRGAAPWKAHLEAPAGVVWRDDGTHVEALTVDNPAAQRSKGREIRGKTPIVKLTDWLREGADVEVATVGFAVLPKDKP